MSQRLKVKVRPGGTVQFPGICIHCSQPAAERTRLKKRAGQVIRIIEVPVCSGCFGELQRKSGEEERLERLGRAAAVFTAIIVGLALFLLITAGLPLALRLALSLVAALLLSLAVWTFFKRRSQDAFRLEKKAILESARMTDFSWRATTFEFSNDVFAEGVAELNEPLLMES
jgi:hypothetical protein